MPNPDNNSSQLSGGSSYLYNAGTSPATRTAISQKVRILTPHYGDSQAMHQMGVVSSFAPTQSKTVEEVRGIGFGDKIAELVPGITSAMTVSIERALLYLCNLWQATGYAAGIDGPVRSIAHHRWPFDMEQQLVFSTLVDIDMNGANVGYNQGAGGTPGRFDGGVKAISFPEVTNDKAGKPGDQRGHTAVITMYEGCWFTSWNSTYGKEQGVIMENGDCTVTDVHDFASQYGEFLATGNDPTLGQLGSIRYAAEGFAVSQVGRGAGGGGQQSIASLNAI